MREILDSSFRDPSGFLFRSEGKLYRQVNRCYSDTFKALEESGLFKSLFHQKLLISHSDTNVSAVTEDAWRVIQPAELPVISYAYEWSFSQLKDAALLTLQLQELAMEKGFSLKDASIYNIQFLDGKPVFIDTLSFEKYREGKPWIAYKQFCQHFLAPLALMSKTDISLQQLLRTNIDGVPLELASKLLPLSTKFSFSLLVHIHWHAKSQSIHADKTIKSDRPFTKHAFMALLDNLKSSIGKLEWSATGTEWNDYYAANNNYDPTALNQKEAMVGAYIQEVKPFSVWDLGANTGRFSHIAAEHSGYVCAWDIDPACVENNYRALASSQRKNVYPLLLDLCNPSPAIGWANSERDSFRGRGGVDLILALGLIHHLVISNNLPLTRVAAFLAEMGDNLVIEFVPKSDSQVIKLLRNREDIFPDYEQESFEHCFSGHFDIRSSQKIPGSERTLYLMAAKRS
jgi:ribosomal protein L11 methylase PrmA